MSALGKRGGEKPKMKSKGLGKCLLLQRTWRIHFLACQQRGMRSCTYLFCFPLKGSAGLGTFLRHYGNMHGSNVPLFSHHFLFSSSIWLAAETDPCVWTYLHAEINTDIGITLWNTTWEHTVISINYSKWQVLYMEAMWLPYNCLFIPGWTCCSSPTTLYLFTLDYIWLGNATLLSMWLTSNKSLQPNFPTSLLVETTRYFFTLLLPCILFPGVGLCLVRCPCLPLCFTAIFPSAALTCPCRGSLNVTESWPATGWPAPLDLDLSESTSRGKILG